MSDFDQKAVAACHPIHWSGLAQRGDSAGLLLAAQRTRILDLAEITLLAAAIGIEFDAVAAIEGHATAAEALREIRSALMVRLAENGQLRSMPQGGYTSQASRDIDTWSRAFGLSLVE